VRSEGCTEIQGFYVSAPKPAAEIRQRELRRVISSESAVA
jgi:EAL domain-containing protein (putative c-di-GMP-specific phosphodiesterase class I)